MLAVIFFLKGNTFTKKYIKKKIRKGNYFNNPSTELEGEISNI